MGDSSEESWRFKCTKVPIQLYRVDEEGYFKLVKSRDQQLNMFGGLAQLEP